MAEYPDLFAAVGIAQASTNLVTLPAVIWLSGE
jgi:hypothetical protein